MSCELPDELQQQLQATQEEQKLEPNDSVTLQKKEKIQFLIKQKKLRTGKMDCVVVMDLTQSMEPYIEKMQLELCNLIADIKVENKELDIRFGFVGYKDFCDDPEILSNSKQKQQIEFKKLVTGHLSILDFSSDLENFQKFLMEQFAEGGGDIPEDVTGALHQSLKLSWRTDSFKIVVLVSDSPTHGEQYQNPMLVDDYPKGHPFGIRLEDVITTYAKMGITDSTEKMFQIIKQEMKLRQAKIRTIDLRKALKREQQEKKEKKEKLKLEKAKQAENQQKELAKKPKKKLRGSFKVEDSDEDDYADYKKEDNISSIIYNNCEEKEKLRRPASFINLKIAEKINFDSDCYDLSAEEEID